MKTKFTITTLLIFVLLTAFFFALYNYIPDYNFITLESGNLLMALLSLIACFMVMKQKEARPQAFVRGVSGASFLKLMVCMIAILIYIAINRSHIHKPTVFVLMGVYAIYSIIESITLSKLVRE